MKIFFFILSLLFTQNVFSQGVTPEDWGLREYHIEHKELGDIYYYVTREGLDTEKPLLFVVQGSGGLPSMIYVKFGESSTQLGTLPADFISRFPDKFHVAYMAKPGTSFCDTITVEEFNPIDILENFPQSREFKEHCDLAWQVQASSLVIDALKAEIPIYSDKIIAVGISEGGRVIPPLAIENNNITHAVCMVSGGLNQFYSSIINNRIDAAKGEISHKQAQANIDSLFRVYEDIYKYPDSIDKSWYGHTYKRWASFCTDIPLEHLVKLTIPIFVLCGSTDRNTPILQVDYIKLEFLKLKKTNLTYQVMPGVDHFLYEVIVEDGKEKGISHRDEAFNFVVDWIDSN